MSKIVDVQSIPIRIPNPRRVDTTGMAKNEVDLPDSVYHRKLHRGLVYTHHRETLFIKVIADDGTVGWGECGYNPLGTLTGPPQAAAF